DVAFGQPEQALPHLALAFRLAGDVPALASSYAHALAGTGQKARAEEMLVRGARMSPGLAHATVESWLRAGKV
ncbi:MAG TPA: hypothetical protein VF103_01345, partial [Polyangiaceae bacterium]